MNILTDSKSLEDSKNPEECNVFKIYKLIGSKADITELKHKYHNGGFGYGHAKNELLNLILDKFKKPRAKYNELMSNPQLIENELTNGKIKARDIAHKVLKKVRINLGLMRT